jgi:ATPase subunit of ABC transporter with duplicated ATPase domains
MDGDVGKLSGGWKMRVALARILLMRPDALLLDEPTNHLDIESILWLEQLPRDFEGALVMTSHDREFMNRLVTKIVEIDGGELTTYTGNYDFYEQQRASRGAAGGAVRAPAGDAGQGAGALHRALQGPRQPRRAGAVAGEEAREDRARRAAQAPQVGASSTSAKPPRSGDDVVKLDHVSARPTATA